MKPATFLTLSALSVAPAALGFSTALFPKSTTAPQQTFPTRDQEYIELPNFDELFGRIKQVSPLARIALNDEIDSNQGFKACDMSCKSFGVPGIIFDDPI
jgi:hypothetical protein